MKFPWRELMMVMLLAAIGRILLLASGTVSFHSDEAVVSLMARHIVQGARPTFFYGQAYMGSLDAWLVALGFQLLGESVQTVRIVQSGLYLLVVASGFLAAWQLSHQRVIATVTGLILALPSTLVATYTTATLGGYNEVLLLGNLIIITGHQVIFSSQRRLAWAVLGLSAGLGWWANGLIIIFVLPVGLLGLAGLIQRLRKRDNERRPYLLGIGLAALGFLVGSAPWWLYDLANNHVALNFYLTGAASGIPDPAAPKSTIADHALGFVLFGLPAVFGMRFSWLAEYFLMPVGLLVMTMTILAGYRLARHNSLRAGARSLIFTMLGVFTIIFIVSPFGADPTGRYFLPLVLPLALLIATLVYGLAQQAQPWRRYLAVAAVVGLVVGYQLVGQFQAIRGVYGLTTQFDLLTHIDNQHDAELIAFLEAEDLYHGHTNYWVAYRLAFLSGESLQYSASLPYKADLSYNPADNRYTPYRDATVAADRVAYITANLPQLNAGLEALWATQDVAYEYMQIGPYHVYYDFEPGPPVLDLAWLTASTS